MPDRIQRQRFVFLAAVLLAVFSYPLLSLANRPRILGGLPLLYVYLFAAWALALIGLFRTATGKRGPKQPGP